MPRSFSDFKVGDSFTTRAVEVTRAGIIAFAEQFDPQPFHLDEDAGKASPFGGLVASGWHTAAISHELMMTDPALDILGSGIGRRIERLDWAAPVRPGDKLHVVITVVELLPPPKPGMMGRAIIENDTINQDGKTVMRSRAQVVIP